MDAHELDYEDESLDLIIGFGMHFLELHRREYRIKQEIEKKQLSFE